MFQFNLQHLFKLISLLALYFALVQAIGPFMATLGIGTFILWAFITCLPFANPVQCALLGTATATMIVGLTAAAFPAGSDWNLIFAWLFYPTLGYILGVVLATERDLRSG